MRPDAPDRPSTPFRLSPSTIVPVSGPSVHDVLSFLRAGEPLTLAVRAPPQRRLDRHCSLCGAFLPRELPILRRFRGPLLFLRRCRGLFAARGARPLRRDHGDARGLPETRAFEPGGLDLLPAEVLPLDLPADGFLDSRVGRPHVSENAARDFVGRHAPGVREDGPVASRRHPDGRNRPADEAPRRDEDVVRLLDNHRAAEVARRRQLEGGGHRGPSDIVVRVRPGHPRRRPDVSGNPDPAVWLDPGPRPVTIRNLSPWIGGDPRPPVVGVGPFAVNVRSPAAGDSRRPDLSVGRRGHPAAVRRERLVEKGKADARRRGPRRRERDEQREADASEDTHPREGPHEEDEVATRVPEGSSNSRRRTFTRPARLYTRFCDAQEIPARIPRDHREGGRTAGRRRPPEVPLLRTAGSIDSITSLFSCWRTAPSTTCWDTSTRRAPLPTVRASRVSREGATPIRFLPTPWTPSADS